MWFKTFLDIGLSFTAIDSLVRTLWLVTHLEFRQHFPYFLGSLTASVAASAVVGVAAAQVLAAVAVAVEAVVDRSPFCLLVLLKQQPCQILSDIVSLRMCHTERTTIF